MIPPGRLLPPSLPFSKIEQRGGAFRNTSSDVIPEVESAAIPEVVSFAVFAFRFGHPTWFRHEGCIILSRRYR